MSGLHYLLGCVGVLGGIGTIAFITEKVGPDQRVKPRRPRRAEREWDADRRAASTQQTPPTPEG